MWRIRRSPLLFANRTYFLFLSQLVLGRLVVWRVVKTTIPGYVFTKWFARFSKKPFVDLSPLAMATPLLTDAAAGGTCVGRWTWLMPSGFKGAGSPWFGWKKKCIEKGE
jgi:hypothetical protein